jgi:hypothetical protein
MRNALTGSTPATRTIILLLANQAFQASTTLAISHPVTQTFPHSFGRHIPWHL